MLCALHVNASLLCMQARDRICAFVWAGVSSKAIPPPRIPRADEGEFGIDGRQIIATDMHSQPSIPNSFKN
jgi:hypothetical protein